MPETTRVLIVDDSPSMRRLIRAGIEADPDIRVVAEAGTAREARDAVNQFAPDVMTLDVEMPGMDGIEFLERLMRARPMPVVMISSLTDKGSDAAIRALELGAIECIAKPRYGSVGETFRALAEILKVAAKARLRGSVRRNPSQVVQPGSWNGRHVLVGSSTGGVEAIETFLSVYPQTCPPTLITQHMPGQFLASFAARLDGICAPKVRLARDGDRVSQGEVLIAPGQDTHLVFDPENPNRVMLRSGPKVSGHRPSVDEMFLSACPQGSKVTAVLLTGMGSDGARGMLELRKQGAFCIAQDRETSVVYGMPRVAAELGGVDAILPLAQIAPTVLASSAGVPAE